MEFQIDDGVPIPEVPKREYKYPVRDLEVGQSFFVPKGSYVTASFAKLAPKKFSYRHVTEDGVKGVRVWRIE